MREKEGEMIVTALATVTIQLSFVILTGDTNFSEFADDISALIYMMICMHLEIRGLMIIFVEPMDNNGSGDSIICISDH